jgi:hypothetical protein
MKTVTIANLPWRAWSPSMFELVGCGTISRLALAYNGRTWLLGINGGYGTVEYTTREEAARVVAKAFADAAAAVEGSVS